jgi:hypothetical protein
MPAHLHPEHYRSLIRRRGESIRWFKSFRCVCNNPRENQYSRNCPHKCYMGYRYEEQVVPKHHKAAITGAKWQVQPVDIGLVQLGDANVIVMPDEIPLNRPDRIILIQRFLVGRELVKKGEDNLVNRPVAKVTYVGDDDGNRYQEHIHWRLVNDKIVWIEGADQPKMHEYYSVEYYFHPSFFFLENNKIAPRPTTFATTTLLPLRGLLTYAHPSAANKAG